MTMSAIEALTNAAVGLVVSWAITFLALPLWGLQPSAMQAGGITGMYFVVSFLRAWLIRECFRRASMKDITT
jgi:hypothetical protein